MACKLGRRILFSVLYIWISITPFTAVAANVSPKFDVTGIWKTGPYSYPFFQNGSDVKSILVVKDFGHYFSGKFISPTKFKGIMTRRQKSTGCVTRIRITYTMTSNRSMNEQQLYLDSKCDLPKGKRITASYTRVK